jgi:hypothetical protein
MMVAYDKKGLTRLPASWRCESLLRLRGNRDQQRDLLVSWCRQAMQNRWAIWWLNSQGEPPDGEHDYVVFTEDPADNTMVLMAW